MGKSYVVPTSTNTAKDKKLHFRLPGKFSLKLTPLWPEVEKNGTSFVSTVCFQPNFREWPIRMHLLHELDCVCEKEGYKMVTNQTETVIGTVSTNLHCIFLTKELPLFFFIQLRVPSAACWGLNSKPSNQQYNVLPTELPLSYCCPFIRYVVVWNTVDNPVCPEKGSWGNIQLCNCLGSGIGWFCSFFIFRFFKDKTKKSGTKRRSQLRKVN